MKRLRTLVTRQSSHTTSQTSSAAAATLPSSFFLNLISLTRSSFSSMDMRFYAKPQSLTLFSSCKPISSSPSLSTSKLRSIRRDFLGCGHNLRPPRTIRSRRRHRTPGIHLHTPRFFFKASLSSDSVFIVITVVTLSTVSVVYYLNRLKLKKISAETSGNSNFELPELDRDVINMNHAVPGFGDLQNVKAEKLTKGDVEESIRSSEREETEFQLHTPFLLHEQALVGENLQSSLPVGVSSGLGNSNFHNESMVVDGSLLPGLSESEIGQSLPSANELNGLCMKDFLEKTESNYELYEVRSDSELSTSQIQVNDLVKVVNERSEKNELQKEAETTSYDVVLSESARDELYMFYESNKQAKKYMSNLSGHKHLSGNAFVLDSYSLSSSLRNTTQKGAEVSTPCSPQAVEYHEGKLPSVSTKVVHHHGRKYFGERNGHPRERNARHLPQNNNHTLPQVNHLNGLHIGNEEHASAHFSVYNRLLKAGRLADSVKLLEDLERKDLLDMNKVYHAKFFRSCKNQKAVKEAFRYIKLIPNPTLSTFNMLMSVCASSQDSEGAFQALRLVQEAGLKADCKLYTTLISTCAKSGKVDAMFEVYHKMVNAGVEPNVHTYGALIDGCARAAQVAKAFGAYGIMSSKNVKPDRVVFNALITACGQSGAVDRAFDVLAEMTTETQPIEPDHITVGALIKACANAGQADRAQEVYKMMHKYKIIGTPEVYTIAVNCCSQKGDWEFACRVYDDMADKGVIPDEMFLSALIDVAGHVGKLDAAFDILQEARKKGVPVGIVSYSSLMGACSNAGNWQKALELYEELKLNKVGQTVPTVNALITALCHGNQLQKAMEVQSEMKTLGLCPNSITYSVLIAASEKKDDLEVGLKLLSQVKKDGVSMNLVICRCVIGMCLRRYEKACTLGESVLSFDSGRPQVDSKWTLSALMVYRETITAGVMPTIDVLSQVLGCLQLPHDRSLKSRLIENQGISADKSRRSNLCSLLDGFGEYDTRAFSLLEEASSLGIVSCVSLKENPVVVDARKFEIHTAKVYLLTVLRGLKHRLAAGAKLPGITILLPAEKTKIMSSNELKTVNLAGRVGKEVAALLRRLGLPYQGYESCGKIRINGLTMKRWFQPKLASSLSEKPGDLTLYQLRLGKEIYHQQRNIRSANLSLD